MAGRTLLLRRGARLRVASLGALLLKRTKVPMEHVHHGSVHGNPDGASCCCGELRRVRLDARPKAGWQADRTLGHLVGGLALRHEPVAKHRFEPTSTTID